MAQGVRTIDKDKFAEAFEKFVYGKVSISEAAKIAGISVPTTKKYFNMFLLGEELPDNLFERKKK